MRGASRVARSWRCAARALARLPRSRRRRSTPGQRCAPPCRRARRVSSARQPGRGATPVRANQLRHAHAVELAREGVPLNIIQRQLGHANLGTTSVYLQGIDTEEIIAPVHTRRAPMMSATAGLRL
ncbi:MAG: site-specific integrase [Solirubrobacteraceae bacterium]